MKNTSSVYTQYLLHGGISVKSAYFNGCNMEVKELHLIFTSKGCKGNVKEKIDNIVKSFDILKKDYFISGELQPIFCRWFLSDSANQALHIPETAFKCATSIIEQPPADGSKIALWIYCLEGVNSQMLSPNLYATTHGAYQHIWQGDMTSCDHDSEKATQNILNQYSEKLRNNNCTLSDNCIRTWFFVRDIDINYKGVITGRNKVFKDQGLKAEKHFISSTGIGGKMEIPDQIVSFNAYAVAGIKPNQMNFLKAKSHLNPTIEYGVAFERGTTIDYGDRRHVFISGTASIDNKGNIVSPGDLEKQTLRMWENVEVLLKEAGSDWKDVGYLIVYLRDFSDYDKTASMFNKRFTEIPTVIVQAPVCRPGWLIEMECMACLPQHCDQFEPF